MRTSLSNNLCNDNGIQNHLVVFTFTNFVNHVSGQAKTIQPNYSQMDALCRETLYSESEQVLTDPQDKVKHKIGAFQNYYMISFNVEQAFRNYCVNPLVSSGADR